MTNNDFLSFGALLHRFRQRQSLTQQHLAEAVGVHRNAIGRWERGDVLPASKAIVLELVKQLHLSDQETRHLLEASLTALSPHWLVPLLRNPYFTGREKILETLHMQLGADQAVALIQSSALHGLGGVGKTQIALEYAYRHALEYSAIFWIAAETDEQVVSSFLHMAETLQLPEQEDIEQQRVVVAVQRWLSTHGQWLQIWDNVEDLSILQRFLPAVRSGAILLTTRCQTLGTLARGLDLLPMEQEEGLLFLLRRAKALSPEGTSEQVRQLAIQAPAQYAAASELVTILGGLPLALDQAGAYLEETRCGLPAYLDLFRTRRDALLHRRGEGIHDHPASVSTTFVLAITAAAERHPAVRDLLQTCALLQSDAIPEEIFRQGGEHLGATLQTVCCDALEWDRVVGIACSYSLLVRQPEEQALSLHRLVQAVLLDSMTELERGQWTRRIIEALDVVFPEVQPVTAYAIWKQCERLLPHALLCLNSAVTAEDGVSLVYKVAQYLRERGQYAEAEPFYQRALHLQVLVLGLDHPGVAKVLNDLGFLYYQQGRYVEAEPLCQRALHIWERSLGPDHLQVAASLTYLAGIYVAQGRYTEAEPFHQRALHIRELALGPDHLQVAHSLNGLAIFYRRQGNYAQAASLSQRALSIREQALGPEHPHVASPLYNLANLLLELDDYEQAEPLFQRALHIWEQTLGPEHPNVAYPLNGLAIVSAGQKNYEQAERLFQRALHIWEQALGPEHPHIASPIQELANLYLEQGKYAQAKPLFQRALSIREQHLGQLHPETAQTLYDLTIFYQKQNNLSEAVSFAERALKIRSQTLGDAHPKTLTAQMLYAQLFQEQGEAQEEAASEQSAERIPDPHREDHHMEEASFPPHEAEHPSPPENDPVQEFFTACCELHPLAWCQISELWHAYQQWTAISQGRVPLPRRAFTMQVKARGCRADRTSTTRIWRGIRCIDKNDKNDKNDERQQRSNMVLP